APGMLPGRQLATLREPKDITTWPRLSKPPSTRRALLVLSNAPPHCWSARQKLRSNRPDDTGMRLATRRVGGEEMNPNQTNRPKRSDPSEERDRRVGQQPGQGKRSSGPSEDTAKKNTEDAIDDE